VAFALSRKRRSRDRITHVLNRARISAISTLIQFPT